jgi:hypothetical protein
MEFEVLNVVRAREILLNPDFCDSLEVPLRPCKRIQGGFDVV